ncbi:MAG: excinuclease ABC subunit UvrC [Deltaproteobacteria bacterium]|nr:excinuclease ABC subunit UvrC [Deltaproteobacteria bacterium]
MDVGDREIQKERATPLRDEPPKHPLQSHTAAFPNLPGVYLFKDEHGDVLYVGKARDLKKRTSSYFRSAGPAQVKTRVLLTKASHLEYVVTPTEKDALLLESSLIKKHKPRYNVTLRDDKSYPSLRIDLREPYPRLEVVRRFQRDGALYFGPYPSAHAVRETVKLLHQVFPLRLCRGRKLIPRERPCLNYSLGQCLGACAGKVTQQDYRAMVEEVILFLQGKTDVLQSRLRKRMEDAARALEFEKAASHRDRLRSVLSVLEKQHIVSDRQENRDVIGVYQDEAGTELAVLFVRQGVVIGQRSFDLGDAQGERGELITAFIQQYYEEGRHIPEEILVPESLEAGDLLQDWLGEARRKRVRIRAGHRGERRKLLEMAESNARERAVSRRKWQNRDAVLLGALQRTLKLPKLPQRMACIDISNIQGLHAVGAVVVFADGRPDPRFYRHFRIRGKQEPDDPAMMAEVVERLFGQEPGFLESLDLLVLDGGKGQLNRVYQLLGELGLEGRVPLISLAKEREAEIGQKGRGMYEKVYMPGRKNPVFLNRTPDVLHLLQRLRDEAHRYAISRYKRRHRRNLLTSVLDAIPGIGPARRQSLMESFGSVETLRHATVEEVSRVPGISQDLAESILKALGEDSATGGEDLSSTP